MNEIPRGLKMIECALVIVACSEIIVVGMLLFVWLLTHW